MEKEERILKSWIANSQQWIETVDHGEIASRGLATNAAIVEAILSRRPSRVLDIGCGEGWLCRALEAHDIDASGVDGSEELIEGARNQGKANYICQSYEEIIAHGLKMTGHYDVIVFNFSLFGETSTAQLLNRLKVHLNPQGGLIIQTLHPEHPMLAGQQTGWRGEDWSGMQRTFTLPYQWYFRTLEDWSELFVSCSLHVKESQSVMHPETQDPISVIFTLGTSGDEGFDP